MQGIADRTADPAGGGSPAARRDATPWIAGVLAFGLYAATASRHLGLPDSAIVLDAMQNAVVSAHACNHTLNNLIGHLFLTIPWGGTAAKANLLSAVYGAVAIGLFQAFLRALGLPRLLAGLCSAVLAVSHSMWWHGTQVENYALSIVFLNACLWLVARAGPDRRCPPLVFFLAGLALLNHVQNGVLTLAAGALALTVRPWRTAEGRRWMARCAAAWALGAAPYVAVLAADIVRAGALRPAMQDALGGGFQSLMFRYGSSSIVSLGAWLVQQFPSPFLLFAALGAVVLARSRERRPAAVFAAVVFAVNTVFFLGYETWDQFAFYLPSFVCVAAAGAAGAERMASLRLHEAKSATLILLAVCASAPPFLYTGVPACAAASDRGFWGWKYHAASVAYRGRYDLVGLYADPVRHDRGTVESFLRGLLGRLPKDAVLVDDVSIFYQLDFVRRAERVRPDLRLELVQPLGMEGWGREADIVAARLAASTNRLFVTATNGAQSAVVECLGRDGFRPVRFPLNETQWVFEMIR